MNINLCLLLICVCCFASAQNTIDLAESTLKVGGLGEEEFYYGFAEGDQLIFNFEEVNGKELKEIEITELPGSSKFMDYKSKKITNKTLSIIKTGIYKFRFSNSALGGRICKFKIQRIPANELTKNFNTSVYWKQEIDTAYVPQVEKYLVKVDTVVTTVSDQVAHVSSQTALNGNPNRTVVDFSLPERTVSWSYYIGVGKSGQEAFEASKEKFTNQAIKMASSISSYGPMAALAAFGVNTFSKASGNNHVKYFFISDWNNVLAFNANQQFMQYKLGDVVSEASQMKFPNGGKIYLGLRNDNMVEAIDVIIKVTAIQINQTWSTRNVSQMQITSRNVPYLKN